MYKYRSDECKEIISTVVHGQPIGTVKVKISGQSYFVLSVALLVKTAVHKLIKNISYNFQVPLYHIATLSILCML